MSNPWFRMYSEFATDPKVQMLSEADQRRYIMLLCLRCSNGDVTLQDCEVAFQLRISNEEWAASKVVLVDKKLIDNANSPVAWSKRQYASDSSAARVAKHREGKKQACNVTVTPPDTDTDTDTDTKKEQKNGSRAKALSLTGWLKSIGEDEAIPADHSVFTFASKVGIPREFLDLAWDWMLDTYGADGLRKAKRYADWPAVFRNAVEGNWPKLWWIDSDGQYRLTTVGEQRKRAA